MPTAEEQKDVYCSRTERCLLLRNRKMPTAQEQKDAYCSGAERCLLLKNRKMPTAQEQKWNSLDNFQH
jgi:hypothetical protein